MPGRINEVPSGSLTDSMFSLSFVEDTDCLNVSKHSGRLSHGLQQAHSVCGELEWSEDRE